MTSAPSRTTLEALAARLDPDQFFQYELEATRLALDRPETVSEARQILESGRGDQRLRLLAFVVAVVGCRRAQRRQEAEEIVRQVGHEFTHPIATHFRSLAYLLKGSAPDLKVGKRLSESACDAMPTNPGALHTLAHFIIELLETAPEGADPADAERALELAERATALSPIEGRFLYRGHFHYTRARILRRLRRYDDARDALLKAMDLEDRDAADYASRIADYRIELALVNGDRALHEILDESKRALHNTRLEVTQLSTRLDDGVRQLNDAQLRIIELVAFVVAIVGLVLQGGTLAAGADSLSAGLILLGSLAVIMIGSVLVLSVAIRRPRNRRHAPR